MMFTSTKKLVLVILGKFLRRRSLLFVIVSCTLTGIIIYKVSLHAETSRRNGNHSKRSLNYFKSNPCLSNDTTTHLTAGGRCVRKLENATGILTEDCDGRLGNQMFGYATLFVTSFYNGRPGYMSPFLSGFITKYFKASLDTLDESLYNATVWQDILQVGWDYKKYDPQQNFRLCGHRPQLWQRYEELKSSILQEFTWHGEIEEASRNRIQQAKEQVHETSNLTLVGVHVRRTDYVTLINVALLPPPEYYESAMKYFQSKYPNVLFVVASDDIDWCQENFANFSEDLNIYYCNGTLEEDGGFDMAVLSKCDHGIFSVGTFGWWSGYLAQGEVIYCSDCYVGGEGWHEYYVGDYATFVLPSWTGMLRNGTLHSLRNSSETK